MALNNLYPSRSKPALLYNTAPTIPNQVTTVPNPNSTVKINYNRQINPVQSTFNKALNSKLTEQSGYLVGGIGKSLSTYSRARDKDFSVWEATTQGALDTAQTTALNYATQQGNISGGAAGLMTAGSGILDAIGSDASSHGNEETGGALAGAGKGAVSGAAMGAAAGPWGAVIGGVAGGVIGGVSGLIGGSKKREERLKREKREREAKAKKEEAIRRKLLEQRISDTTLQYDEYGRRIARNGLKTSTKFNIPKTNKSLISSKPLDNSKKLSKFKRGGKTNILKENIIPDGVTHCQYNKTGIKGDKGLAIVKDGEKEYEVEKEELMLNLSATTKAEKLSKRYDKDKEDKHLIALGRLMSQELLNNTYDYTKKFKVNRGKPLKDSKEEVLERPKEGTYNLIETDIKAEGGKLQVLGKDGEVLCNMEGGFRIFSRTHTKKLIELAKAGKTKEDLKKLGKYMYKVINKQDNQEAQYVE